MRLAGLLGNDLRGDESPEAFVFCPEYTEREFSGVYGRLVVDVSDAATAAR